MQYVSIQQKPADSDSKHPSLSWSRASLKLGLGCGAVKWGIFYNRNIFSQLRFSLTCFVLVFVMP